MVGVIITKLKKREGEVIEKSILRLLKSSVAATVSCIAGDSIMQWYSLLYVLRLTRQPLHLPVCHSKQQCQLHDTCSHHFLMSLTDFSMMEHLIYPSYACPRGIFQWKNINNPYGILWIYHNTIRYFTSIKNDHRNWLL